MGNWVIIFWVLVAGLLQPVEGQLKHMAAHGHDLKHKHASSHGAPTTPKPVASSAAGEDSRPVEFEEAFAELLKFFKENKHSKVPQAVTVSLADGTVFRLGKWVQRQRQLYKNTYTTPGAREGFGQMTDSQRDKLATVEFMFDPTPQPKPMEWDHAWKQLAEFKKKNGNTLVPEKTFFDDGQGGTADLGKWSQRQRQLYKNTYVTPGERKGFGKLSEDRKAKLESLDFKFET